MLATRSSPSDHIKISHYDLDPLLDLIHQHNQSNWICRILAPLNSHQTHQQPEPPVTLNIIAQMVYATTMNQTCVHMCFHQSQPAYRSINIQSWLAAISNLSYTQFRSLQASVYRSRISIIKYIEIVHFKPFDPDLSLDLVLHQPVRSLLSSDQAMHHQPITCILDLILHQIFNIFLISFCLMIFFSFYSLRPYSIPWSKTI